MKTMAAAVAIGLVGMFVVPASIIAMNLNEQQMDRLIGAGVGICGGSILLAFVALGVVLAARYQERRKQQEMGWGATIEVPRESWRPLPAQQSQAYRQTSAYQLPAPIPYPQQAYSQHQMSQVEGFGQSSDYDLMPEAGQDERFRFTAH